MTTSSCSYMRVNGGGLKDVSDQIIRNVRDADECEQMCLVRSRIADPCRSYTHDNSTSECHLMWASSRLLGRSPLENMKESLSHGDLDDCMNFSLKCKEKNIEVKASSMKMFVGRMMTKKEKTTICETKFDEGKFDFSSKFDFDTCGLRTSNDEAYRGMVFLKEGSTNLVTIRDKILQVNCRMHLSKDFQERSEQSLSIKMKVENRNKTDFVMSDDFYRKPSFSLKILSSNFSNVDSVRIGDYGWIVLDVQNSDDDFTISNLFAKDINSGRKIRIIDEDGCVIRRDFIQKIEKKPNQIKFKINFSGFQRETEVIYITKVETCTVDCLPKCNLDLLDSTKSNENILTGPLSLDLPRRKMVRRAVEGEPRKLELTNDVYEVRGHRLILLNPKKLENNFGKRLTSDVSRRKHLEDILEVDDGDVIIVKKSATLSSSFRHCFIDDVTCLFTIVLASVQLFLLFSCCLIMYFYYQQWRQIRQMNMSIDHHVEYYRFDGTTSLTPKESSNSEVQETTS